MSFTFITSTGAGQSLSAAKKVRGHITRAVFAQRRADRAQAQGSGQGGIARQKSRASQKPALERGGETHASANDVASIVSNSSPLRRRYTAKELALILSAATSQSKPRESAELLEEFWSIILSGTHVASGPRQLSWQEMLASEPAFIEATMAAALDYWCSSELRSRAEKHRKKAVVMIIDRIQNHQCHTDGFLGAVLTMSVHERLFGTEESWQMHTRGIAGAVQARRQCGIIGLPATFDDLMVLDGPNVVFGFPRIFHADTIHELKLESIRNHLVLMVASMAEDLAALRQLRNQSPDLVAQASNVPPSASEAWVRVSIKCHMLRAHENSFVRCTAKAMELILNLTCAGDRTARITELAKELKNALAELPGKSCIYMDLSSCSLILGAIAAEKGSEEKNWFIARLRTGIDALRQRGWADPYSILEKTMCSDHEMLAKVQAMRTTVLSPRLGQLIYTPVSDQDGRWYLDSVCSTYSVAH